MFEREFLENVIFACSTVVENAKRGNIIIGDVSLQCVKDTVTEALRRMKVADSDS